MSKKQLKATDGVHSLKLSDATSTAERKYSTRVWRQSNIQSQVLHSFVMTTPNILALFAR